MKTTNIQSIQPAWIEIAKLIASGGSTDELYGVIGAYRDDNTNGNDAGAAYIFKRNDTPDLSANGTLIWPHVQPGNTVTDEFYIENIGDPVSKLTWEISECPAWGNWTFTPMQSKDLTPETGPYTIHVTIRVPNKSKQQLTGEITIHTQYNITDYEHIPVSLTTPYLKYKMNHILNLKRCHFIIVIIQDLVRIKTYN